MKTILAVIFLVFSESAFSQQADVWDRSADQLHKHHNSVESVRIAQIVNLQDLIFYIKNRTEKWNLPGSSQAVINEFRETAVIFRSLGQLAIAQSTPNSYFMGSFSGNSKILIRPFFESKALNDIKALIDSLGKATGRISKLKFSQDNTTALREAHLLCSLELAYLSRAMIGFVNGDNLLNKGTRNIEDTYNHNPLAMSVLTRFSKVSQLLNQQLANELPIDVNYHLPSDLHSKILAELQATFNLKETLNVNSFLKDYLFNENLVRAEDLLNMLARFLGKWIAPTMSSQAISASDLSTLGLVNTRFDGFDEAELLQIIVRLTRIMGVSSFVEAQLMRIQLATKSVVIVNLINRLIEHKLLELASANESELLQLSRMTHILTLIENNGVNEYANLSPEKYAEFVDSWLPLIAKMKPSSELVRIRAVALLKYVQMQALVTGASGVFDLENLKPIIADWETGRDRKAPTKGWKIFNWQLGASKELEISPTVTLLIPPLKSNGDSGSNPEPSVNTCIELYPKGRSF